MCLRSEFLQVIWVWQAFHISQAPHVTFQSVRLSYITVKAGGGNCLGIATLTLSASGELLLLRFIWTGRPQGQGQGQGQLNYATRKMTTRNSMKWLIRWINRNADRGSCGRAERATLEQLCDIRSEGTSVWRQLDQGWVDWFTHHQAGSWPGAHTCLLNM